MDSAEQFFSRINARVIHQGNRAFYSANNDAMTMPPFAAFFTETPKTRRARLDVGSLGDSPKPPAPSSRAPSCRILKSKRHR